MKKAFPEMGVMLGEQHIGEVVYADDLILLAVSPEQLQKKLDGLQEVCNFNNYEGWVEKTPLYDLTR